MSMDSMGMRRRAALAGGLAALALVAGAEPARAQADFPSRTVTFVVPFAAGSATDTLARVLGQRMSPALGQSIVIDNAPGASGILGAQKVARATPDGHTVLIGTNTTNAANPSLFKKLPYDPATDFAPVAKLGTIPLALVVHPSVPAGNVQELIAYGRANPAKLSFGSGSASSRLAGEMFKSMAGVEMVHVPYKSNPPAITDLIGGQIGLVIADLATTLPHARDGKLKALAVTSAERTALAPDLPTMAEAGVPGYELTAWFAAYAPAQTPKAAVQKLHDAFADALAEPEVAKALRAAGIEPSPSTPEDLRTFTAAETEKWARLIKLAGIEPE